MKIMDKDITAFKDSETENIFNFMLRNTNENSTMNLVFRGNYKRQLLTAREVFEICCFIASALMSEQKNYRYIIYNLLQYDQKNSAKFLDSVYSCCKSLMEAINFSKLEKVTKNNIFDLCADLMDFKAKRHSCGFC